MGRGRFFFLKIGWWLIRSGVGCVWCKLAPYQSFIHINNFILIKNIVMWDKRPVLGSCCGWCHHRGGNVACKCRQIYVITCLWSYISRLNVVISYWHCGIRIAREEEKILARKGRGWVGKKMLREKGVWGQISAKCDLSLIKVVWKQ